MNDAVGPIDRADELRERIRAAMPRIIDDLCELTRIPSVSAADFDHEQVERSARATASLLEAEGVQTQIVRAGGQPAVLGHKAGPAGAPTILLYAHHDVQPPGPEDEWTSPAFEPTQRQGRLYGRGAADDKAGIMAHIAALRVWGDDLPVNLVFFIEGEEEVGSESLPRLLAAHREALRSDVIVLADSQNWEIGTPALTTSLRGMFRADVSVRTLDHAVHSGMFGGPVPDAITALTRLLASLHDEQGGVAVAGLRRSEASDLPYDLERLRAESGMLEQVSDMGTGSILSRLWNAPSITTIGLDVPSIAQSSNTLVPAAKARISVRLAPDEDPAAAFAAVCQHLEAHTPFGAQLEVELVDTGAGFAAAAVGPNYSDARAAFAQAWGVDPVDIGVGGSIPFVASFAECFPEATILVTGVEDPDTRAHGTNESLHLGEFERVCLAEALLLGAVGARGKLTER